MKKHHRMWVMILTMALAGCGSSPAPAPTEPPSSADVTEAEVPETQAASQPVKVPEVQEPGAAAKELWERSMEYSVSTGTEVFMTLDHEGDPLRNEDPHVTPIRDVLTNDIIYYAEYRKTFQKGAQGNYHTILMSRLYAPDGEMLLDWDETEYTAGIGDWVVSREYQSLVEINMDQQPRGRLLDPHTGATAADVLYLEPVGSSHAISRSYDDYLALLDADGNPVLDLSTLATGHAPETFIQVYRDYLYVAEGDYDNGFRLTFYDENGDLLGTIPHATDTYVWNTNVIAPYISVDNCIYDPTRGDGGTLEPLFCGRNILYYDNEVCVDMDPQDETFRLYDSATAEPLSAAYRSLQSEAENTYDLDRAPATCFYAVDGETILRLDRRGNETAREQVGGLCGVEIYDDYITVNVNEWTGMQLLDTDLKAKMNSLPNKYIDIYPIYDVTNDYNNQTRTGLWIGRYYLSEYAIRTDILADDGTPVMKGISENSLWKDGRMAVKRGQSVGLIDADGQWISRTPVSDLHNGD